MTENSPQGHQVTTDIGQFAIVPLWLIDAGISDRGLRLYVGLHRWADQRGEAWPSHQTIADYIDRGVSTIKRAAADLVAVGALAVSARTTADGDPDSNHYELLRSPVHGGQFTAEPTGQVSDAPRVGPQVDYKAESKKPEPSEPKRRDALSRVDGSWPAARDLCQTLADHMVRHGCKQPNITATWVTDMRRLIDLDEVSPAQIDRCLAWIFEGPGDWWIPNIASPRKLRSKYEQLRLQAKRQQVTAVSKSGAAAQEAAALLGAPTSGLTLAEMTQPAAIETSEVPA